MAIVSLNPSTLETLTTISESTPAEIQAAVQAARLALPSWKQLGVAGRIKALRPVVDQLIARQTEFAELISQEMGMPISQSIHDVTGAADYFTWYLDHAEQYLAPEITFQDETYIHEVHYEPTGVVAAITPWNYPASNVVWMVGQNLIVGNTVILKNSEEVPLCAKLIEEIFASAKLPTGVFTEVYGAGEVGDQLIHLDIDMICFTGSTATGKHLYQVAAERFLRIQLELGGSAAGIVCADADLDAVLDIIYANRFDNCGQICDGLKRLIVHESKLEELLTKLTAKLESAKIGVATDEQTDIGPLVSQKQLTALKTQVADALAKGAKASYQKQLAAGLSGNFYPPTLLTNITPDMKVWREEVFGPVLPIVTFTTEEEAIQLANDTQYGLGGYIFTTDSQKYMHLALQLQTGMVQHNTASYVQPPTPFGGCKTSGIGREHGKYGFHELATIKTISREK